MGRMIRPHLPGTVYLVGARTQWREPLFDGLQLAVTRMIRESAERGTARPLAYAVLHDELQLVLAQGTHPLGTHMQPLLVRIAMHVNRRHARAGYVFGRRYDHQVCLDAGHLREAVVGVHLAPVRAGLCADADEYAWTSHAAWFTPPRVRTAFDAHVEAAVRVFAEVNRRPLEQCRADYIGYLLWRQLADAYQAGGGDPTDLAPPECAGGDAYWRYEYGFAVRDLPRTAGFPTHERRQLRRIAEDVLAEVEPMMELDTLRSGGRIRALVRVRRRVIARCRAAGYRLREIAAFLGVSTTAVSSAATAARKRKLE